MEPCRGLIALPLLAMTLLANPASSNEWLFVRTSELGDKNYVRYVKKYGPRVVEIRTYWTGEAQLVDGESPAIVDCKRRTITGSFAKIEGSTTYQHFEITPSGSYFTTSARPNKTRISNDNDYQWKLLNIVCNQWGGGVS